MFDAAIAGPRPAIDRRDYRLDLARGLCLFVIMIDHMRLNDLAHWTFGQFGLSDAAQVFFFVSGYTAAIAFGRTFDRAGWFMGAARVMQRAWTLYVANLAVIFVVAALPGFAAYAFAAHGYADVLELGWLFNHPEAAIWGIVTLTYVPGHLDILPVYVVLLASIPVVVALARINWRILPVVSFALWLAAWVWHWNLPADPSTGRGWYFDPLSWQLLFVAAFILGKGWVRIPSFPRLFGALATAILLFGLIVRLEAIWSLSPALMAVRDWTVANLDKSHLGPLELLHFAAIAYLGSRLLARLPRLGEVPVLRPFIVAGQQSLPVFLGTIVLSNLGAMAFDQIGTGASAQIAVNGACFAISFAIAYFTRWIKSAPWKNAPVPKSARPQPAMIAAAIAAAKPAPRQLSVLVGAR